MGLQVIESRRDRDGLLLAIDIGTTTVRAMLFDLAGRRVGEARYEPPVLTPGPYMAEVEPGLRYDLTRRAVRDCLQAAAVRPEQVLALSLSGLQHALVPLDAQGRVLDNAMLWMDQRCAPQAAWMSDEHGALLEELFGRAHMSTTIRRPLAGGASARAGGRNALVPAHQDYGGGSKWTRATAARHVQRAQR